MTGRTLAHVGPTTRKGDICKRNPRDSQARALSPRAGSKELSQQTSTMVHRGHRRENDGCWSFVDPIARLFGAAL